MKEEKPSSMNVDSIQALEAISFTLEIKKRSYVPWMARYEELKQHKLQKGHSEVPQNYNDNPNLDSWVLTRRKHYRLLKEGKPSHMSVDRIGALEFIGFTWKMQEKSSVPWIERYEELKQYKLQKGHCEVPSKYNENPSLGWWVKRQRTQYRLLKEGKSSTMSEERIGALEFIGFTWQMRELSSVPWTEQYEELKHFRIQKGHCEVPQIYNVNPCLGKWVSTQRTQYKLLKEGKPSNMNEDRIGALEFIGFTWRM